MIVTQPATDKSRNPIPALKILCNDVGCCQSMTNVCFECTHNHNASLEPDRSIIPMQYLSESPVSCHFPQTKLQTKPRESGGKYRRPFPMCWLKQRWLSEPLTRPLSESFDLLGAGLWFAPLNPAFFRVSAEKGRVKWASVENSRIIDLECTSLILGWSCFSAEVSSGT